MSRITDVANVWRNIKEIDLRPLREEALQGVRIALVGNPGSGRHILAEQMRRDPARPAAYLQTPLQIIDLEAIEGALDADLSILMVNAGDPEETSQRRLVQSWSDAGVRFLVFLNSAAQSSALSETNSIIEPESASPWLGLEKRRLLVGSAEDTGFLTSQFVPAVMRLLPHRHLALARHFPLFRVPVAHDLINDTSYSNAAYALSTGIAEIVPLLNVPLNVADMVVLTKAQAFLVYKLGLALGLSTRWADYVAEFGGVLGGGFVWRQIARQLVGLVPVWGIVPKVAVAYAGTSVIGHVILQWYLTGRHISRQQMGQLYRQAFARGKNLAQDLTRRLPRRKKALPKLSSPAANGRRAKKTKKPALSPPPASQTCQKCGRSSASDAQFCQYCGHPFAEQAAQDNRTGE